MPKKQIYWFLSIFVIGSLLAACGAPAATATEPPAPPPAPPSPEVIIQTVEVPIESEPYPDGTELKILQWLGVRSHISFAD